MPRAQMRQEGPAQKLPDQDKAKDQEEAAIRLFTLSNVHSESSMLSLYLSAPSDKERPGPSLGLLGRLGDT